MRDLTVNEVEQVAGGAVIALPVLKWAGAAVLAAGALVAKHLRDVHIINQGADLCREGLDVSVKLQGASLSCKNKPNQGPSESLPGAQPNQGGGLWLPSPWRNSKERIDGTT